VLAVLIGCNPKPVTSAAESESVTSSETAPISSGYFKATGNEPFWAVEIGEDGIRFTSMIEGLEAVNTPHAEPTRAADANVKMYNLRTEATDLDIEILQQDCQDSMADTMFPYAVRVRIKRTAETEFRELTGCGRYLTDPRLAGRWILTDLLGLPVMKEDYPGDVPNIEIDAADNTISGHAGCNRMNGKIFWERGLLRFNDIVTTRMACPALDKETALTKAMQSATSYVLEGDKLALSNPSMSLAVFRKAD
jgi:heat shock protein HslJ/uncharacterized membrane protein